MLRCVQCHAPLPGWRAVTLAGACGGCGARIDADGPVLDFVGERFPPRTLGARAMQSTWLASLYERWWRPVLFAASTGLGAPGAAAEARRVLGLVASSPGPWLDVSCGPGTLLRRAGAPGRELHGVDLARDARPCPHGRARCAPRARRRGQLAVRRRRVRRGHEPCRARPLSGIRRASSASAPASWRPAVDGCPPRSSRAPAPRRGPRSRSLRASGLPRSTSSQSGRGLPASAALARSFSAATRSHGQTGSDRRSKMRAR